MTCEQFLHANEQVLEFQNCEKCNYKVEKPKTSGGLLNFSRNQMICTWCSYSWCWDCYSEYSENHGLLCNPFGCKIMKNSRLRHPCIRWMLRIMYTILLIILIPILIVFFLPCASAYRGGNMVNECMVSWND